MLVNPSKQKDPISSPIERSNSLNDPDYINQEGYYGYDLTHPEYITPRFGEINPCMHLDTIPADRHTVHDNTKTVINQINGNLLSTVNQYIDSFYIPLRACFPNNYEKLIPNPTKGDDLPNSALPMVDLQLLIYKLYRDDISDIYINDEDYYILRDLIEQFTEGNEKEIDLLLPQYSFALSRLTFVAYMLSRGQLLDYLGIQFDANIQSDVVSHLQAAIDRFFASLWEFVRLRGEELGIEIYGVGQNLISDNLTHLDTPGRTITNRIQIDTLSHFRQGIADTFERGSMFFFTANRPEELWADDMLADIENLVVTLDSIFGAPEELTISSVDRLTADQFRVKFINISKVLAYQLAVAQYFTNDSVDNVFTSELYMQNLRAVMFPARGTLSSEPIFTYNGVQTEYDYISFGGFHWAVLNNSSGVIFRQHVVASMLFLMRRSLRYGDKFATARPRMLAVGQLEINVEEGSVSPIDVTRNLLAQRFLNAANYIGSGFLKYYASMYGVTPSDTGVIPRFLAHRKIVLQNQITNNTAENQGYQTTNLVGYSDNSSFDVFIDDFGFIISVMSFDVMPVYTSGIDDCYFLFDRFDYFNPMMQNIGDQPVFVSELSGNPDDLNRIFGYQMRNAEYKYKVGRAHGAFVNQLPGFLMKYPTWEFIDEDDGNHLRISPMFIRDKSMYLDQLIPASTGYSPGQYYHFAVACLNEVHSARKIQRTPSVLF